MISGIIAGGMGAGGGGGPAFGTHSYWRLFVTNNNGNASFIALAELEFLDGTGALIAATGGSAIASSVVTGGSAADAFDSSTSTSWATTSGVVTDSWIGYQFPSPVGVEGVRLGAKSVNPDQTPKDCTLQYSDDGMSWTDVFSFTNRLWVREAYTQFPETLGDGYHRAWRVFAINVDGGSGVSMQELELRATAGGADQTSSPGSNDGNSSGRAISSFVTGGGNEPWRAFDNTSANWFISSANGGSANSWIGYIFPDPVKVEEISITAASTNFNRTPKDMLLQYSDDGVNWETQKTFPSQTGWSSNETRVLTAI
jgi:F5/8 type C domain.